MKPNAHLYLPDYMIDRHLAECAAMTQVPAAPPQRPKAEILEGGCELYRLVPRLEPEQQ